jgi:hypothetical protein
VPFATRLIDADGEFSLAVDGFVTPVEFTFVPDDDLVVTELSLIFEGNGKISLGDSFAHLNTALTNGVGIVLRSQGIDVPAGFRATRDLLEYSSPEGFLYVEAGGKSVVKATRKFTQGLRLNDRHGDGIKLVVQDDLTGFSYAIASVLGYTA